MHIILNKYVHGMENVNLFRIVNVQMQNIKISYKAY
jgi:hypothetical protein